MRGGIPAIFFPVIMQVAAAKTYGSSMNLVGDATQSHGDEPEVVEPPSTDAAPAAEVVIPPDALAMPAEAVQEVDITHDMTLLLRSVSSTTAARLIGSDTLGASDLLPGQYEGGLKLWESAVDLARHLVEQYAPPAPGESASRGPLAGLRVIELGCGHGLPGIVCALAGAEVFLQDYNAEALTTLAAPNLQLNARMRQQAVLPARFFSGNWAGLGPLLASMGAANSFDLVVSAETIYSQASMQALYSCIKQCLKPNGSALVAAKTMYFGLDGGTLPFQRLAEAKGATVQEVAAVRDGVARQILEVRIQRSTI